MLEDLPRFALAGFLGAAAMSVFGLFTRLAGLPAVDLGQIVATKLVGIHVERDTRLGIGLHLVVGVVLALFYGTIIRQLVVAFPGWLRGPAFGVVVWLVVMLLVMPLVGEGAFGVRVSRWLAPIALVTHLVYGAILGAVAR